MPKQNLHQGKWFAFRNGIADFFWKGMATKQDPEAQSPDRPRLVVNGRYVGGHIVSRPPLSPSVASIPLQTGVDFTPAGWELAFLGEHHSYSGTHMWWGSKFVDGYFGGTFGYVDTDNDPEHNEVAVHYQTVRLAPILAYYGGFIYAGGMGALRRLYRIAQTPGVISPVPVRLPADEVVVACPGYFVSALHVHDGKLYYARSNAGAGDGELWSWDGFQDTLEYTFATSAATGVAITTFQEKVVVAAKGEGSLVVRAADGTWSTVTVGGFTCSGYTNSLAQLKNGLYVASGTDKIYLYDGATVALVRTLATGTGEEGLNCLCGFNGRLYYAWKEKLTVNPDYWPWLGMFDPDTVDAAYKWKDDYVTLGLGTATVTVTDAHSTGGEHPTCTPGTVTALAVYRQRLFAAVSFNTGAAVEDSKIMTHAVVNNPFSAWYVTHAYEDTAAVPAGPVYFAKQLAATGTYNERLIQYFRVF